MSNTKTNICNAAIELFNKNGFNNVSMRDIASAANIAVGNLTYHFPQKSDLLVAIQENAYSTMPGIESIGTTAEETIGALIKRYSEIVRSREKYPFFYRNNVEMCNESTMFYKNVKEFRKKLYRYYSELFQRMRELGVMKSELGDDLFENLTVILICLIFSWEQEKSPYYDVEIPSRNFISAMHGLITPYFTSKGYELYMRQLREQTITRELIKA